MLNQELSNNVVMTAHADKVTAGQWLDEYPELLVQAAAVLWIDPLSWRLLSLQTSRQFLQASTQTRRWLVGRALGLSA